MSKANDISDWGQYQPQRRNIIINGDSRIWQRGTITAAPTAEFLCDRFKWVQAGSGTVTYARSSNRVPPHKVGYSMLMDVTTIDSPIPAGNVYGLNYQIEANDMQHLAIGTSSAATVTLSFWVYSSKTGIHSGSLRNGTDSRSYVFEYTVNSLTTWEYKTVTIDLDTTGTWLEDNNLGMSIFFSLATGTSFQGTVGVWTSSNTVGSANQVNLMDNTTNDFLITDIQLEVGSEATDFEYRSYAEELALCQRYYCKSYAQGTDPGTSTSVGIQTLTGTRTGTIQYTGLGVYPVTMRIQPTTSVWGNTGTTNQITGVDSASLTFSAMGVGDRGQQTVTATTTFVLHDRYQYHWTSDAEL